MKYKSKFKRIKAQAGIGDILGPQPELLPNAQPNYNWMTFPGQVPANPNAVDPGFEVNNSGDPVDQGRIVPLQRDANGNVFTTQTKSVKVGTGRFKENPYVEAFNIAASEATGIANMIQNNRLKKEERRQILHSLEPRYWQNMEAEGLNNIPMYTQYGGFGPNFDEPGFAHTAFYGDNTVYKYGGMPKYAAGGLTSHKAKIMLKEGMVNGEPLTDKQKRYFGWVAGGRKQAGGIADLLWQSGIDGSYVNRKKLFNDYFAGNYSGTAEQNIKLFKDITSGKLTVPGVGKARVIPAPKASSPKTNNSVRKVGDASSAIYNAAVKSGKNVSTSKPALESGVIVDKRKNQAYVVKNGKVQKQFPVITGKNQDMNSNPYSVEYLDKHPELRNTPMGAYFMNPRADIYGAPGYDMNPLFFDGTTPNAANLAMHVTYDPSYRNQFYGTEQANKSYGCINCRKPDLAYVTQQFPKGDTVMVIDSKKGQSLKKMGIKQAGGGCDDCNKKNMKKIKQTGGLVFYQGANTKKGAITPTGQSNAFANSGMTEEQVYELANKYGFRTDSNINFQTDLLNYAQKNRPDAYNAMLQKFGQTAAGSFADNILGARTINLLQGIQTPAPQPQQKTLSYLTEWMYGPNKHAIGLASRPFTEHTDNKVTKTDQFGKNPQFVDFMFNKPDSPELDTARGRYRIPYDVYINELTGGTNTFRDPSKIQQYLIPGSDSTGVKQTGGDVPNVYGLPDEFDQFADVEAEAGEVIQKQNGGIVKVADNAKTHEQGGEMIPGVKRVLEDTADKRKDPASKMLKVQPETIQQVFGFKPSGPVTHAKAFELVTKELKKTNKLYQDAKENANMRVQLDKTGINTLRLNEMFQGQLPTEQEVFDMLFHHQEGVKAAAGINDDGSMMKMGGKVKKAQAGIGTYSGGKTKEGRTTPTGNNNAFNFPGGLEAFKKAWSPFVDLSKFKTVQEAQAATYDYLVKNQPEVAASIWQSQGLTAKGRKLIASDPKFAAIANQVFDKTGKLKEGVNLTPEQLSALTPAYADNMLGIRAVTPSVASKTTTEETPVEEQPPVKKQVTPLNPNVTLNPNFVKQPNNEFYEPTYWSDIAAPFAGLVDSFRRWPELYNPMEFNQLRYKMLDPTAALTANQADFNAAVATTNEFGNSGAANANKATLLGQKYRANNQVMSQYDNQNAQIKNNEIAYNTQVRDKQSVADAQSREKFYTNVLLGREAQRQQFLTSLGQLARVDQMKRRQNTSGNLLLKLSPAFNQFGEYNGYQYVPYLDPSMVNYNESSQPGKITSKKSKTQSVTTWKDAAGTVHKTTTSN